VADEDRKQLGKILLKQKVVSPAKLDDLLEKQRQVPGTRLASAAIKAGAAEVDVLRALSEQHQVPGIDLNQVVIPVSNLQLVPPEVARQYFILPFSVNEQQMMLAMADPQDRRVLEEIEFVTGRAIVAYVAVHEQIASVIDDAYRALANGEQYWVGKAAPAEYLAQLGLKPKAPPPPPPPSRGAPPPPPVPSGPQKAAEDFSDLFTDEAPVRPATAKGAGGRDISALDPAFESRVAPLPEEPRAPKSAGPKKVLVVDDEDDIRRLLRRVLVEKGYRVVEASRGSEALQAVRDEAPDVILLDAMLPEIHGFDIVRRIRGSQKYGHIPIVMVSAVYRGWRFAEDLKEAYGVAAFLEKPFKIGDVVAAVERALLGREEGGDEEAISEPASEVLASGIEAYRRGDLDVAIAHLKKGVGIDPLAFRLHYHLGLLYGRRDDVFDAIASMETAVDLSPKSFAALKNLAVLYQRAGFKHKAIEVWERALGSAPDDETRRGIKEHLMSLL
jgi:CheY-like chemotaxis protein